MSLLPLLSRTLIFCALLFSFSVRAEFAVQEPDPGPFRGGHVVVNPSLPVAPKDRFLPPAVAEGMTRQQDAAAKRFIRNYEKRAAQELAYMDRVQGRNRKAAVAEQARAFNALTAAELFSVAVANRQRLLRGIEALQKQIASDGLIHPPNLKLQEALAAMVREYSTGPTGQWFTLYEGMTHDQRMRSLTNNKAWLIGVLAKLETSLHTVTFGETAVRLLRALPVQVREGMLSRNRATADGFWTSYILRVATETKQALANPHVDSIYHPSRRNIVMAHPSHISPEGQDLTSDLNLHGMLIQSGFENEFAIHFLRLNFKWAEPARR